MALDLPGAEDTCFKNHPYINTVSHHTTDESGPDASGDLEKIDSRHDEEGSRFHKSQHHSDQDDDKIPAGDAANNLSEQKTSSSSSSDDGNPQAPSALPERVASRLSTASSLTFPEGGLAGWLAVVGAFCAMLNVFGLINSSAVFESYFSEHQLKDYSSSQIGWIFSLYLFVVFFVGIQVGPVFDRHGPRRLVPVGSLFMVLSLMLLGLCTGEFALHGEQT